MSDQSIAQAVWGWLVKRGSGDVPAIQELADAKTNTIELLSRTAPVVRGGVAIPMRQEWADAKTLGIQANAKLDELLERPVPSVPGLTEDQLNDIAIAVASKISIPTPAEIAKAVNDESAARMKE